jgi:hypothetical protein
VGYAGKLKKRTERSLATIAAVRSHFGWVCVTLRDLQAGILHRTMGGPALDRGLVRRLLGGVSFGFDRSGSIAALSLPSIDD